MVENIKVEVEPRSEIGKNANRRLREAGRVPGIVYGLGGDPFMVAVSPRRVDDLLRMESGQNTIFTLALSGSDKSRSAMIKELQRDPIRGSYLHADFYEVDLSKAIEVSIPIHFLGRARGVEFGGIVDHPVRELEISCLPGAIPDAVEQMDAIGDQLQEVLVRADQDHVEVLRVAFGQGAHDVVGLETVEAQEGNL